MYRVFVQNIIVYSISTIRSSTLLPSFSNQVLGTWPFWPFGVYVCLRVECNSLYQS